MRVSHVMLARICVAHVFSTPENENGNNEEEEALTKVSNLAVQALLPEENGSWVRLAITVLILICIPVNVCLLCGLVGKRHNKANSKKRQQELIVIFSYLQGLPIADIDIQKSPIGGYNIYYLNGLSQGKLANEDSSEDDWDDNEEDSETVLSSLGMLSSRVYFIYMFQSMHIFEVFFQ